jgi:hypothetical protein
MSITANQNNDADKIIDEVKTSTATHRTSCMSLTYNMIGSFINSNGIAREINFSQFHFLLWLIFLKFKKKY